MESRPHLQEVTIPVEDARPMGTLALPQDARSLVLFAHGSGSSPLSPRNWYVAAELNRAGIGTLLMDLLSEQQDTVPAARIDIAHLFEAPGTLEAVARCAVQWFERYLGKTSGDARGNA